MNDRYLYRAKRVDNGEWVEGALFDGEKHCVIGHTIKFSPYIQNECKIIGHEVYRDTICQCCGYERIYEHDIFECDEETYEIVFDQDELAWFACGYGYGYRIQLAEFKPDEINVIGNSFDNPELLEEEE